ILAIDNDEWSYENTIENLQQNNCKNIDVRHSVLENVPEGSFNIILANINRHILLQYMTPLYNKLVQGGTLLMSGLLTQDRDVILSASKQAGLKLETEDPDNNWIVLRMKKKN